MIRLIICLIMLMGSTGCQLISIETKSLESVDPVKKAAELRIIEGLEAELALGKWQKAEAGFREFAAQKPQSVYFQRAQFGLAQAIEEQGQWTEAAEIYRQVIRSTQALQPEIAAQAFFAISFCYENLGDEPRVLSSLMDAQRLAAHLTDEKVLAEIPARLAASYYRLGRGQEAQVYLEMAENGVRQLRGQKEGQKDTAWLAMMYFRMGHFSTSQLTGDNLLTSLDTLSVVQSFSLRSIEEGIEPWSKMATDKLIENYQSSWQLIQALPASSQLELGAARRQRDELQIAMTEKLLILIAELKQRRLPPSSVKAKNTEPLFNFLEELRKQAQVFMASKSIRNPLTPEAESLGGLKR